MAAYPSQGRSCQGPQWPRRGCSAGVPDRVPGVRVEPGRRFIEKHDFRVVDERGGDAEAVRVIYDPERVSYARLLEVFWRNIDPLSANRQFCDAGEQYRSAIFYHSPGQKTAAEQVMANLGGAGLWRDPVVTEVTAASVFYIAEAYHQEYFANNPGAGYCQFVVAPTVAKFRKHFLGKLKQ